MEKRTRSQQAELENQVSTVLFSWGYRGRPMVYNCFQQPPSILTQINTILKLALAEYFLYAKF